MEDAGEEVHQATDEERTAARVVLLAIDQFFYRVRQDHGVPDEEMVPCEMGDLNNVSQAKAFFLMVAEQGVLTDG